jgi:hypothetical protein
MRHYDSDPETRAAFHNTNVMEEMMTTILKTGWASSNESNTPGSSAGQNETDKAEEQDPDTKPLLSADDHMQSVCDQPDILTQRSNISRERTSGIHTIRTGWTFALDCGITKMHSFQSPNSKGTPSP